MRKRDRLNELEEILDCRISSLKIQGFTDNPKTDPEINSYLVEYKKLSGRYYRYQILSTETSRLLDRKFT